jgi:hypothetical protein
MVTKHRMCSAGSGCSPVTPVPLQNLVRVTAVRSAGGHHLIGHEVREAGSGVGHREVKRSQGHAPAVARSLTVAGL